MIFLFFSIIIALILFLGANEYYRKLIYKRSSAGRVLHVAKMHYDMMAFGSTYCFFAIKSSKAMANFGVQGQFFYYTDKMMKHFIPKCLNSGGIVYIIIADLVFSTTGKGWYSPQRYIGLLPKDVLGDEYSFIKYLRYYRFPLIFNPKRIASLMKIVIAGNKEDFDNITVNPYNSEQTRLVSEQRCNAWCQQFGLKDTVSDEIPARLEEEFVKTRGMLTNMIQFCIDQAYIPVLVVTPVSRIMNDLLSDKFLHKVLYANIEKANKQNVPFLDYLRDSRFADYNLYDKSGDCLNATGRELFTKLLIEDTYKLINEGRNPNIS